MDEHTNINQEDIPTLKKPNENSLSSFEHNEDKQKKKKKYKFNWRIFTSLTISIIGFVTLFSGLVLLGFGKGLTTISISLNLFDETFIKISEYEWNNIHTVSGISFSIIGSLHFYWNWKRLSNYYSHPRRKQLYRKIVSTLLLISFILSSITGLLWFFTHLNGGSGGTGEDITPIESSLLLISTYQGKGIGGGGTGEGIGGGGGGKGLNNLVLLFHTISSLLLLTASVFHVILNWKSLKAFFSRKTIKEKEKKQFENKWLSKKWMKKRFRFWGEILAAILLSIVIIIFGFIIS
ncbi:DUF4405 domain-containing protein [Candidatus Harpocratesius sp.]